MSIDFSPKQKAFEEFKTSSLILETTIDFYDIEGLKDFFATFVSASVSFGLCELHARQAERSNALGIDPDRVAYEERRRDKYQAMGLNSLSSAIELINSISQNDFGNTLEIPPDNLDAWEESHLEFKELISDLEISSPDAVKFWNEIQASIDAVTSGGENALVARIKSKVLELDTARRSPDRGTTPNIPWWKIVIIAVIVGITIWLVVRCFRNRNCRDLVVIVGDAIITGYKLVSYFC